jgi:hypothetical protein
MDYGLDRLRRRGAVGREGEQLEDVHRC